MSMTESATEQNLANGFAAPSEVGEVQAGNPLPIGGAHHFRSSRTRDRITRAGRKQSR